MQYLLSLQVKIYSLSVLQSRVVAETLIRAAVTHFDFVADKKYKQEQ